MQLFHTMRTQSTTMATTNGVRTHDNSTTEIQLFAFAYCVNSDRKTEHIDLWAVPFIPLSDVGNSIQALTDLGLLIAYHRIGEHNMYCTIFREQS
jgi:hypothetical protein